MVTQIDQLADFLNTDTVPKWLLDQFEKNRQAIVTAIETGNEYTLTGPAGEVVTFKPELVAA